MKLWGYYALHTFLNTIKKMFRSTFLIVILACVGFGVIFGLVGGIVGSVVEQNSTEVSTEAITDENGDFKEDEQGQEEHMSPEDAALVKTCIEGVVALVFLAILLWGMYTGSKNGTDIFMMADVNLLFTAPMKPQSVLMFRLSFQMVAALAASVYMVFQIPNLMVNLGLGIPAVLAISAGWILLIIFQRLMVVLTYTVCSTHERLKQYVIPFIWTAAAALIGIIVIVFLSTGRDLFKTVELTLGGGWSRYIPVIGWYKGMIMSAVEGEPVLSLIYLLLLLVCVAVFIYLIWHIKADFYEDALSTAGKMAEIQAAAKEGRSVSVKERSKHLKRTGNFGGSGASVFFTKEVFVRQRMAKFGFLTNTMLFYLLSCAALSVFSVKVFETHSFMFTGCMILAILFFRNFGNPIGQETARNWLFLVPDNPYKKVFFAMLAGTCSCGVDLLPGMVVSVFILQENVGLMLLWYITFLVVDFMLSGIGVLLEYLVPASSMDVVKSMIQMFLRLFMILVLTVFMVAGYLLGGVTVALLITSVCSAGIGFAVFLIYPWMLHNGTA